MQPHDWQLARQMFKQLVWQKRCSPFEIRFSPLNCYILVNGNVNFAQDLPTFAYPLHPLCQSAIHATSSRSI